MFKKRKASAQTRKVEHPDTSSTTSESCSFFAEPISSFTTSYKEVTSGRTSRLRSAPRTTISLPSSLLDSLIQTSFEEHDADSSSPSPLIESYSPMEGDEVEEEQESLAEDSVLNKIATIQEQINQITNQNGSESDIIRAQLDHITHRFDLSTHFFNDLQVFKFFSTRIVALYFARNFLVNNLSKNFIYCCLKNVVHYRMLFKGFWVELSFNQQSKAINQIFQRFSDLVEGNDCREIVDKSKLAFSDVDEELISTQIIAKTISAFSVSLRSINRPEDLVSIFQSLLFYLTPIFKNSLIENNWNWYKPLPIIFQQFSELVASLQLLQHIKIPNFYANILIDFVPLFVFPFPQVFCSDSNLIISSIKSQAESLILNLKYCRSGDLMSKFVIISEAHWSCFVKNSQWNSIKNDCSSWPISYVSQLIIDPLVVFIFSILFKIKNLINYTATDLLNFVTKNSQGKEIILGVLNQLFPNFQQNIDDFLAQNKHTSLQILSESINKL
ncbi:hypothetical protein RCL1_005081 [Eukaryota sp. TZLM3-RCL]